MNEKREKQKEEEKVNKDRKMRSETIILRPEVPLLERLSTYAASDAYPFHMPGHKRQVKMGITSVPNPFSVDITEIDGFDNLHHAEDILKESMNSAAAVYGADRSWYLVNGSTCGILAAIAAAVKPGEKILMARNSHKSAYHAVVLNQLEPVYLYPEEVPEFQIPGEIEPEQVERALLEHPEIRAVFVTSPTYEGIVSDIQGIAATAHRHGAALIVDEAHGAHLPFGDGNYFPDGALQEGADLVIQSLHKTLPSLTQTAILHLKSQILDAKKVEQYLSVYQSSSPSYILIASMENCVRYMAEKGAGEMARYGARLRELREKLAKLKHFRLLKEEICGAAGVYGYDPSKLVLFPDFMTGTRLAEVLRTEYHLEAEMSSGRYVLLMTSFMDTEEGFSRLERALLELDARVDAPQNLEIIIFHAKHLADPQIILLGELCQHIDDRKHIRLILAVMHPRILHPAHNPVYHGTDLFLRSKLDCRYKLRLHPAVEPEFFMPGRLPFLLPGRAHRWFCWNIKTGSARRSCLPAMDAVTFQTVCRSRSATAVVSRIFHGRRLGRLRFR